MEQQNSSINKKQ